MCWFCGVGGGLLMQSLSQVGGEGGPSGSQARDGLEATGGAPQMRELWYCSAQAGANSSYISPTIPLGVPLLPSSPTAHN